MLRINNLNVSVDNKVILEGLDLSVDSGQIVFIMGKNGCGKSTLAQALMGNPQYTASGSVIFKGQDLLEMSISERSNNGLFVSFQHPVEISGVNLMTYLKEIINTNRISNGLDKLKSREILDLVKNNMKLLNWDESFLKRNLNEGMSGGEKKKCEILQMLCLNPDLVILDEIDSGLDVQALADICTIVVKSSFENRSQNMDTNSSQSLIIITHNPRILDFIIPDKVIVIDYGKVARIGDYTLAQDIFVNGFDKNIN